MKFLKSLDGKVAASINAAYLWMFDRTGVFVGTIGLLIFAANLSMIEWGKAPSFLLAVLIIIAAINLVILGYRYWLQGSGNTKIYNAQAAGYLEQVKLRLFFNILCLQTFVLDAVSGDWRGSVLNILIMTYGYIPCILIRDRDKKPWWETRQELAMERT